MNKKSSTIIDLDAYEELKENIIRLSQTMEVDVLKLQKKESYKAAVSTLFREFHNLKALTSYLGLKKMASTVKIVEDVLSILRKKESLPKTNIVDWLLQIADSIHSWEESIDNDESDFEVISPFTLNMIKSSVLGNKSGNEILKTLNVLYVDENASKCADISKTLKNHTKQTSSVNTLSGCLHELEGGKTDILVVQNNPKTFDLAQLIEKVIDTNNMPILIVGNAAISERQRASLKKIGINFFLENLESQDLLFQSIINEDELLLKLFAMAKAFFCEKGIKIQNSQIAKKISELSPLSSTTTEIMKLKTNPNASLKDIADIVTKDPFVSAKMLKIANSPFSGLKGDISTIHHAVSLLGKDRVVGLTLQCEIQHFITIDLSPYMMCESDFNAISCLRMNLATYWYPKVNVARASHIATAALLGNLGQIVIANEAIKTNVSGKFKELLSSTASSSFAEIEVFGVSAEDITADILQQWGINEGISNLLRCSNDITQASDDLKKEAIALYVIFNTIPSIPISINKDKVEEMADFLSEMNFNADHYLKAVDRVIADAKI